MTPIVDMLRFATSKHHTNPMESHLGLPRWDRQWSDDDHHPLRLLGFCPSKGRRGLCEPMLGAVSWARSISSISKSSQIAGFNSILFKSTLLPYIPYVSLALCLAKQSWTDLPSMRFAGRTRDRWKNSHRGPACCTTPPVSSFCPSGLEDLKSLIFWI